MSPHRKVRQGTYRKSGEHDKALATEFGYRKRRTQYRSMQGSTSRPLSLTGCLAVCRCRVLVLPLGGERMKGRSPGFTLFDKKENGGGWRGWRGNKPTQAHLTSAQAWWSPSWGGGPSLGSQIVLALFYQTEYRTRPLFRFCSLLGHTISLAFLLIIICPRVITLVCRSCEGFGDGIRCQGDLDFYVKVPSLS